MVQEMVFINISYLNFWWPLIQSDKNDSCNFGNGHDEKHVCVINLNLDK